MRNSEIVVLVAVVTVAVPVWATEKTIDDFESYQTTDDLTAAWSGSTSLTPSLNTIDLPPRPHSGLKDMQVAYAVPPMVTPVLQLDVSQREYRVGTVTLWYRGDPANDPARIMLFLTYEDGSGSGRTGLYGTTDDEWHSLTVDFNDNRPVRYVEINIENEHGSEYSYGSVNFDDITLHIPDAFSDGFESGSASAWSAAVGMGG